MFKVHNDEPEYVFLPEVKSPRKNQYGDDIELAKDGDELAGKSLNINGDNGISEYPDRYKQHGFYFNADNCISCHACESACSEKNDLPPYLAYRSVGYVEGGTYPSYTRLNISMACNHCDDPVCLKGCPTRAYTKFAEYGAVLQDPESYENMRNAIGILKLISQGENEIRSGNSRPQQEVFENIENFLKDKLK